MSVCCVQPGSEIAHDLEQYSGAAHALAKAAYCQIFPRYVKQQVDQYLVTLQTAEAVPVVL